MNSKNPEMHGELSIVDPPQNAYAGKEDKGFSYLKLANFASLEHEKYSQSTMNKVVINSKISSRS